MAANKKMLKLEKVRCTFIQLDQAYCFVNNMPVPAESLDEKDRKGAKYSMRLLIPKTDKQKLKSIEKLMEDTIKTTKGWDDEAKQEALEVAQDRTTKYARIKDGDEKNKKRKKQKLEPYQGHDGHIIINLTNSFPVSCFGKRAKDENGNPIELSPEQIKSTFQDGYWYNVWVQARTFTFSGEHSIKLDALAVQLCAKDTIFGRDFGVENIEDGEDEIENDDFSFE